MIELLERQKKLTSNQWKLICTANLADLLDFFDFFLIGYVTAALTKQWSLTYWEGGAILLASGLGAVPGAFFWGWLGDRIGRRKVFIMSAITISLATGVMVFTPGPDATVPGFALVVIDELGAMPEEQAMILVDLAVERAKADVKFARYAPSRLEASPHAKVRDAAARIREP